MNLAVNGDVPKKYKLVFLGEQSVGKTSLITRFMYDSFDSTYQATIGIDFLSKTLVAGDKQICLQIWDTAGTERFRSLIPSYIRDLAAAVAVYDISSRVSFEQIDRWVDDVRKEKGEDVVIILCANKTDLTDKRKISMEQGARRAKELGAGFLETSAKTGHNVKKLFKQIASALSGSNTSIPQNRGTVQVVISPENDDEKSASSSMCGC